MEAITFDYTVTEPQKIMDSRAQGLNYLIRMDIDKQARPMPMFANLIYQNA